MIWNATPECNAQVGRFVTTHRGQAGPKGQAALPLLCQLDIRALATEVASLRAMLTERSERDDEP